MRVFTAIFVFYVLATITMSAYYMLVIRAFSLMTENLGTADFVTGLGVGVIAIGVFFITPLDMLICEAKALERVLWAKKKKDQ